MNVENASERGFEAQASGSALLVLGMHRSGTSAITGALGLCGAWVGEEMELTGLNVENPRGFWERRDIRRICDQLLHAAGADWWKVANFDPNAIPHAILVEQRRAFARVVAVLNKHPVWVVKEPRLCFLLPVLRDYVNSPICIHIVRNPLEVAWSLQNRNGFGLSGGLALWEAYNQHALNASRNLPRVLVSYESLMLQPVNTLTKLIERLGELSVTNISTPNRELVEEFIDPSLYRYRASEKETVGYLSPSQHALWQQFRDEAVFGATGNTLLPQVSKQYLFDLESTELSLNHYRQKTRELISQLREHAKKLRVEGKQKDRLEKQRDGLEKQRDGLTIALENRHAIVSTRDKRIRELTVALKKRDATILNMRNSISWKVTAPVRTVVRSTKRLYRKGESALKLLHRIATRYFLRFLAVARSSRARCIPQINNPRNARGTQEFETMHASLSGFNNAGAARSMSTYIVPGSWWNRHADAARDIARSGQAVIVTNCRDATGGDNVVTVSGTNARALALSAVATETAIEIQEDTDTTETEWLKWREVASSGNEREAKSIKLWTADTLISELASTTIRDERT